MAQTKMNIAAGLVAGTLLAAGQVQAEVVEDHNINFSNADSALPDATDVFEWGVLGHSYISTTGGNLLRDPGAQFTDNIAVRFEGFNTFNQNDATPSGYGNGTEDNFELTAIGTLQGQNTSVSNDEVDFDFTGGSLELYLDSANLNSGASYTPSDFTDLSTFEDGEQVENFNLIGSLFGNGSDGDFDFDQGDGRTDPKFEEEQLVEDFVTDPSESRDLLYALTDTNNEEVSNSNIQGAFEDRFGQADGDVLLTSNDGSNKKAVPAPATVALLGIGLVALGGMGRRRKKAPADL
ncbi:flocculation-associated PEP-CTERM protein PepA [Thiohalorhabdus sp.]|uniref:flocculation-associated PEP-CTERM protein PepA n=1 Tax=Thiohalorhabdus sp. TaxID=3094134 RepID=UPI002FC3D95B